jgi:hypothetical protein
VVKIRMQDTRYKMQVREQKSNTYIILSLITMKEMDEEKIVSGFRKAVQDFLVPELREAVGELKQMNKRLESVENSISELRADIREDRREVFQKIDDSHEKTREVLIEEIRKSAKLEVSKQKDKNVIHGKNSWLGRKNLHTKGQ